ncbi:hypothetical protein SAMN05421504_104713 [Amycolatopsis xylanica]|uniref:Uncharacterized protein n=1 Tax=Amycolatopsis xylanica TaxID=589385 RepID=A0A1H3HNG3_9PSEU|nr:hypothetical protein [Amycolatopsis xylanica]SDY16209.1 hypothetical protein SAMN05421504_104713 [Amycolatopsis xylanica]
MKPTITAEEANRLVEDYAMKVREALPPEAEYKLYASENRGSCTDPSDNGAQGRVLASRSYEVNGLPSDKIPSYFDALRTWWLNHGFHVLDNTPQNEFLWVENNADGFRMTFKASPGKKNLFLISTSPCVWPGGKPLPTAQGTGNAPGGQAQPVPPPTTATPSPVRARRPRPKPVDEEVEDFDQIDWTDS